MKTNSEFNNVIYAKNKFFFFDNKFFSSAQTKALACKKNICITFKKCAYERFNLKNV